MCTLTVIVCIFSSQAHDHMDPHRLGPLFWEECIVPEQGLEKDGQASVVYCCDRCGQQPVVGLRWHCRVCKDFDLCDACYNSIADSADAALSRPGSAFEPKALDFESQEGGRGCRVAGSGDAWLYPVNVDPSDEETLMKLAVAMSLEPQARPSSVVFASALLRALCASLSSMIQSSCGPKCIPTIQLLHRLITNSSLRDDGTSMALVARNVVEALLASGPLQPSWGTKRLQAPCLALLLLAQLISGPDAHMAAGTSGKSSVPGTTERAASLRWAEQSSHVVHSNVLEALSGDSVMLFLRHSLEAAMAALETPESMQEKGFGAVNLLERSEEKLTDNLDALCQQDRAYAMAWTAEEYGGESQAMTSDALALVLIDTVLHLLMRLHYARHNQLTSSSGAVGGAGAGAGSEWGTLSRLLCKCLGIPRAAPASKVVRRLLRRLSSSRAEYDAVRDRAAIALSLVTMQEFVASTREGVEKVTQAKAVLTIGKLARVAHKRSYNWQFYCRATPQCLALLVDSITITGMPADTVEALLKLLALAFSSAPPSGLSTAATGTTPLGGGNSGPEWAVDLLGGASGILPSAKKSGLSVSAPKTYEAPHRGIPASGHKKHKNPRPAFDTYSVSSDDSVDEAGDEGLRPPGKAIVAEAVRSNGDRATAAVFGLDDDSLVNAEAVCLLLQHDKFDETLRHVLLQSRAPRVRATASRMLLALWSHGSALRRQQLLQKLLRLLPALAESGIHCRELLGTLGTLAGLRSPPVSTEGDGEEVETTDDIFDSIGREITLLIRREALLVAQHPNASLYESLQDLVNLEGYYLESQPCLICTPWAEVPMSMHTLAQLRSEAKFSDHSQLVKLVCSHAIQRFSVTISDVRRLRQVKKIELYYNNKPVPDIMQLKGKWNLWKRFATLELAPDQHEASVDLAIPIVATNLLIDFSAFHEQAPVAQRMLCPRCNRPVTDRHGVCRHCRENAFQCRLCRNINYENLDAFLCNECGYCKHARFEFSLVCKPSFSAEPVHTEEDKIKAIETMERESEKAHKAFEEILTCKKTLERLLGHGAADPQELGAGDVGGGGQSASAAGHSGDGLPPAMAGNGAGGAPTHALAFGQEGTAHGLGGFGAYAGGGLSGSGGLAGLQGVGGGQMPVSAMVKRKIQTAAVVYCKEAKQAFHRMSNSVELLTAVRVQLTRFLCAAAPKDAQATEAVQRDAAVGRGTRACYGCSSRLVMHAMELVERLASRDTSRRMILEEGLLSDVLGGIMQTGSAASRRQARAVACLLVRDDATLTDLLLREGVLKKVEMCLQHSRALDLNLALRNEMQLLAEACQQADACWERKYQTLLSLLFQAVEIGAEETAVATGIILPTLEILAHICCSAQDASASARQGAGDLNGEGAPLFTYAQWEAGVAGFDEWQLARHASASTSEARVAQLSRKYGRRWLRKWRASKGAPSSGGSTMLLSEAWIKKLLLNRCSQVISLSRMRVTCHG